MLTSLALIFLFGLIFGALFQKLRLPPLLGMLIVGIVLGPYALNWLDDSLLSISADLRQIALIIILTRAGLNLNISDLKKVGRPAILMCFLPACCCSVWPACGFAFSKPSSFSKNGCFACLPICRKRPYRRQSVLSRFLWGFPAGISSSPSLCLPF